MRQKRFGFALMVILAFSLVLVFTSCEQLSVNRLRANYHFNKANQFFKDGKFRRAITSYEEALKNNPQLVEANRFLGESYKSLYKPGVETPDNRDVANKALESFTKAYEAEPTNKEQIQAISARLWSSGFLSGEHAGVSFRSLGDPILFINNPPGVPSELRRQREQIDRDWFEVFVPGDFVWDPRLRAAFPKDPCWWLYGHLLEEHY